MRRNSCANVCCHLLPSSSSLLLLLLLLLTPASSYLGGSTSSYRRHNSLRRCADVLSAQLSFTWIIPKLYNNWKTLLCLSLPLSFFLYRSLFIAFTFSPLEPCGRSWQLSTRFCLCKHLRCTAAACLTVCCCCCHFVYKFVYHRYPDCIALGCLYPVNKPWADRPAAPSIDPAVQQQHPLPPATRSSALISASAAQLKPSLSPKSSTCTRLRIPFVIFVLFILPPSILFSCRWNMVSHASSWIRLAWNSYLHKGLHDLHAVWTKPSLQYRFNYRSNYRLAAHWFPAYFGTAR